MIRGKLIAEMPGEQGDRLRTGLTTLEMIRLLGDTAHKLSVQAEILDTYLEKVPEGIAHDGTAAFLAMRVRQWGRQFGHQSDQLGFLIGLNRHLASVTAPDSHVFTVVNKSGEYPISFRESDHQEAEGEVWSAPGLRRMIGSGYSFVADTLLVDNDINGTVAPIFAHAGDMRCLVGDLAIVDLVPIRELPGTNS